MNTYIDHVAWSFHSILKRLSHIFMGNILLYIINRNTRYDITPPKYIKTPTLKNRIIQRKDRYKLYQIILDNYEYMRDLT